MKEIIGYVLPALIVAFLWCGIWWTGLWIYTLATSVNALHFEGLLVWAAISLALTILLMWATAKWGV